MAKERRMAYMAPALNADLKAMAEDIDTSANELLEVACELLVAAWRAGLINNQAELHFGVVVAKHE